MPVKTERLTGMTDYASNEPNPVPAHGFGDCRETRANLRSVFRLVILLRYVP